MRRRFTAIAALLVLGAITAPWVSAQIFDVTVREINAIPQDSIDALNAAGVTLDDPRIENAIFNDLVGDTVRVQGVVLSDPTLSGLSSPNNQGLPSRVHFFIRDTAAVSQGVEGMGLQIVDGSWQENGVLSLLVGDVVEIVGRVAPFDEVMQVAPVSITVLGQYVDLGIPASILDPVVITTGDAMKVVGPDNQNQANWDNLANLRGQYVRIENAIVQRRDISSDRPNWTFSSDAGATQLYIRDLSLAYRNDRDGAYDDQQFRVFTDDFVPPPPGAGINIQGFLFMDDFDPFAVGTDPDVLIKISPMEREDLEVTVTPPVVSNVSRPETVLGTDDSATITADAVVDPSRSLTSVELKYYTSAASDTMTIAGTNTAGDTFEFTIPPAGDGDFVTYWVVATDNIGAESQAIDFVYRVLGSGITTIAHIQETVDGGPGISPFDGLTVSMNIQATVNNKPDSSGWVVIQDDAGLAPWSGILLEVTTEVLNLGLKPGDVVNVTAGTPDEIRGIRFDRSGDLTGLAAPTVSVVSTGGAPLGYKVVGTDVLQDPNIAEAHEGMMLRFENAVVTTTNADAPSNFGEFAISSDGTEDNQIRVDDASDGIPFGYNDTLVPGSRFSFVQGVWSDAFGDMKLMPEDLSDIGEVTNVANEELELPTEYAIGQNYPNPFNPSTTIQYDVPATSRVSIRVYDMLGRQVATLVDREVGAGTHSVTFDAQNLASGVYLYRLEAAGKVMNRSMMLLK